MIRCRCDSSVFTRFVGSPTKLRVNQVQLINNTKSQPSFPKPLTLNLPWLVSRMIAIFVSCLLFIFGLICTLIPVGPPAKLIKLLQSFQPQSKLTDHNKLPARDPPTAAATGVVSSRVELKDVFATFDRNNDGFITRQELSMSLRNMGIPAEEGDVADMVEKVDSNGDGLIDLDEFCSLFDSDSRPDGDLMDAFNVFDENKDGLITVEELGLVLSSLGFKQGRKMEDCQAMIRKVDVDGDGMVNFDEFKLMMKDGGLANIIPLSSN